MKVLIIGGSGLISTPLTRKLKSAGHSVTHYNRGKTQRTETSIPVIEGDRRDYSAFAAHMSSAGTWDVVIDMVCYVPDDASSLLDVFRGRTGHLIVCSTIDVYAKPASRYPIADDEPHAPIGSYAINKSACEKILLAASDAELPVTIIRPAHTYGPESPHRGHILNTFGARTTFLDRLRKGKPVIVHGDGTSLWTSCHAEDVAAAFTGAMGNQAAFHKAYHATGEEWLTWEAFYRILAEILGAPRPAIVRIPTDTLALAVPEKARLAKENFRFNNIFDNSAARRDLGFRYSISFREGMRRTIEWVEKNGGFEDAAAEPWYDDLLTLWGDATAALEQATTL